MAKTKKKISLQQQEKKKEDFVEIKKIPVEPLAFSKNELIFFIVIIIAAFFSRFFQMSSKSFWIDEFGTYQDAMNIFNGKFYERTHFLSFILVHLSLKLGYNEFTLRLPSCLAGVLVIPAMYLLAKRALGIHAAAITSIIVLFSPYQIHFSQEARYYTQVTLISTLMLYVVLMYANKFNIFYIIGLLILGFINYGIHLSSAIFTIALILVIAILFFYLKQYKYVYLLFKSHLKYKIIFSAGIIIIIYLVFLLKALLFYFVKTAWTRLILFPNIPLTEGVSFSLSFFLFPFKRFPLNYGASAFPSLWILFFLFFILGIIYCIKNNKKILINIFFTTYIFTYISIFAIKADIPFTEKYIIFLYPNFFLLYGAGIYYIVKQIHSLAEKFFKRTFPIYTLCIIAALCIGLLKVGDIKKIYFEGMFPTKKSLRYLQTKAQKDDYFLCIGFADVGFKYYCPQFGFDSSHVITLDPTSSTFHQEIIKAIDYEGDVWLIFTIPNNYVLSKEKVQSMVEPYFRHVQTFSSYLVPGLWDHDIYILKKEANFLTASSNKYYMQSQIDSAKEKEQPKHFFDLKSASEADKLLTYTKEFSVLEKGDYYIILRPQNEIKIKSITASIDNQQYNFEKKFEDKNIFVSPPIPLDNKKSFFEIQVQLEDDLSFSKFSAEADISTSCLIHKHLQPYRYSKISPYITKPIFIKKDDDEILILDRSSFVEWDFNIDIDGNYQMTIKGLNDYPPPVFIQINVDDKFLGIYSLDEGNDKLSYRSSKVITLNQGKHKVTAYFINSLFNEQKGADENRICGFSDIFFDLIDNQEPKKDDDISKALDIIEVNHDFSFITKLPILEKKLSDETWGIIYNEKKAKLLQEGPNAVILDVDYDLRSNFGLCAPISYPKDKRYAYFNVHLKAEELINQSSNIHILGFTDNNQLVWQMLAYPTGITGTTDWIEMPVLQEIPKNIVKFSFSIVVYRNSVQPAKKNGLLHIKDPTFWFPNH